MNTENNETDEAIQELVNSGLTYDEAKEVIQQSWSIQHENDNDHNDSSEQAIQELINAGLSMEEATQAINLSIVQNNHVEQNEQNYNDESNKVNKLIEMGFDKNMATLAMLMYDNDINTAIQYLLNNDIDNDPVGLVELQPRICQHEITQCQHLKELAELNRQFLNNNEDQIERVNVLNNFHHLLIHHGSDNDFEHIYRVFGGKCQVNVCNAIKRHFRERERNKNINCNETKSNDDAKNNEQNNNDAMNNKWDHMKEIFDQIHCHFRHQYDIGSRLNQTELDFVNKNNFQEQKQDEAKTNTNLTLIKLTKVLQNKMKMRHKLIKINRSNKYISNLGQIKMKSTKQESVYSFSFPFGYNDIYNQRHTLRVWGNKVYSDLYVRPKHKSLKHELLNNVIYSISIQDWDDQMIKAMDMKETINARLQWAKSERRYKSMVYFADNPIHCGIEDKSPITENHLISLIIYCSFDEFQKRFTETFRKTKGFRNFHFVKQAHSNFHHFAKHIRESVEVFGIKYYEGDIKTMYHGINKTMVFTGLYEKIYGVLSTTFSWNVALQFSLHLGTVLELVPSGDLPYFRCDWLSPFPSEGELLFIGGWREMNFQNVTNAAIGREYKEYILSIRAFETMTKAFYFMIDTADLHKRKRYQTEEVLKLKLNDLSLFHKKLCLALIYHELNRNGYKNSQYPQIAELPELDDYVDQLLHQICSNKRDVCIDLECMNRTLLKKMDGQNGGYIGYLFLKSLFCTQGYEGINLEVLNALYPNLVNIVISNLSLIHSKFLDDIIKFIGTTKMSNMILIQLEISHDLGYSNILDQIHKYKAKFERIGFCMHDALEPIHQRQAMNIIAKKECIKCSQHGDLRFEIWTNDNPFDMTDTTNVTNYFYPNND